MKTLQRTILLLFGIFTNPTGTFAKKASSAATTAAVKNPPPTELKSSQLALAGAVATAFGATIMHPIDTVKTLQQSDAGKGLSLIAASGQIAKNGGIGAFYSGLGPYVTSDGTAGALKFASYEVLKKWIKDKVPEEQYGAALFGCAALAFLTSSVALVPGELLKQRLQMGQISSIRQGIKHIFKTEGILGFYSGYSGVCLRDIPYTMLELGIYDNLKSIYLKIKNRDLAPGENERPINQMDEILAAAISGGITGYLTSPFDTVKTKLMVDTGYKGFFDCVAKTVQSDGVGSLFNGSIARVAWLMPFTAIYLPVYELLKRRMETAAFSQSVLLSVKGGHQKRHHFRQNPAFGMRNPAAVVRRQPAKKSLKFKHTRYERSVCF